MYDHPIIDGSIHRDIAAMTTFLVLREWEEIPLIMSQVSSLFTPTVELDKSFYRRAILPPTPPFSSPFFPALWIMMERGTRLVTNDEWRCSSVFVYEYYDLRFFSASSGRTKPEPNKTFARDERRERGRSIPQERAAPSYVRRYYSTIMVPSITQPLFKKLALSLDWGPNLSIWNRFIFGTKYIPA